MNGKIILNAKNITKRFAGVTALDRVNFSVEEGEIHALMGENGAGKSTLMKIITGLYSADEGTLEFVGKEHLFSNVLEAQKAGISTVFQELNMIPHLTVSENIFIGRYPTKNGNIDWKKMHQEAQHLIDEIGIDIDVRKKLNTYNTAKQQIISIIRAVNFESKLIILDEPTSSLDTHEVEILFDIMNKLKEKGTSIIFITHRIDEVYRMCDRITVLKDGKYVGTYPTQELSQMELLKKMIGRDDLQMKREREYRDFSNEEVVLEVKNLKRIPAVRDVSFKVRRGEIVGLSGLLGAGRTETARLIFGCDPIDSGEIYINGEQVDVKTPGDATRHGLAFCTENRREEGIFANVSVMNNIAICSLNQMLKAGMIDGAKKKKQAAEYIDKLRIKTSSDMQLIKDLSGGNQQKVILARWMATKPKLIILDEPTRGIDVGAKSEIENLIKSLADSGVGVIYISSEMTELENNCDRIVVLRDGYVVEELSGDGSGEKKISKDNIMKAIAEGSKKIKEMYSNG